MHVAEAVIERAIGSACAVSSMPGPDFLELAHKNAVGRTTCPWLSKKGQQWTKIVKPFPVGFMA